MTSLNEMMGVMIGTGFHRSMPVRNLVQFSVLMAIRQNSQNHVSFLMPFVNSRATGQCQKSPAAFCKNGSGYLFHAC
jgi:hypothetical protein